MSLEAESPVLAKPEALLRVPVGLSSPLWGFYAGAAMSGATWWWMTRWARPQNLEAMFGKMLEAAPASIAPPEPVVEAAEAAEAIVETVIETAPDPVIEPLIEAVEVVEAAPEPEPEPVLEALAEAPTALETVEVAPEPVAAPAPVPKPRAKKAEPKAD